MTNAANELEPGSPPAPINPRWCERNFGELLQEGNWLPPARDTVAAGRANETVFVSLLYLVESSECSLGFATAKEGRRHLRLLQLKC